MASTLNLDMADPATKQLVDGWADNTEYTVTMTVKTGAGAQRHVATVVGPVEAEEPEPVEEEAPTEAPGPAAVKQAMSMGGPMGA